jgi:hypothetical protein
VCGAVFRGAAAVPAAVAAADPTAAVRLTRVRAAEPTAAAAEVFNEIYAYLWRVRRQKNG